MTTDFNDDPILTAYILGEVDETQRAAIEQRIATEPELAEFVAELRAATELLTEELGAEPAIGLSDIEKQKLMQTASAPTSVRSSNRMWWMVIAGAGTACAVAAALVLVVTPGRKEEAASVGAQHRAAKGGKSAGNKRGKEQLDNKFARLESTTSTSDVSGLTLDPGYYRSQTETGAAGVAVNIPLASTTAGDDGRGQVGFHLDGNSDSRGRIGHEGYDEVKDNDFIKVSADPRSTFSIDVDTGSYSNIRRFLSRRQLPPKGAVRIEEMINYFDYAYQPPEQGEPFSVRSDVTVAPWNPGHRLVRVSLKGRELEQRPNNNLVFLLDVSGSMHSANKLPLLRSALSMLVGRLGAEDRIAIVVYAGASGLVLPSTPVSKKHEILSALERLRAGGSTNAGAGIELAYQIAIEQFIEGGNNRVILATDGDFNVGTTSRAAMLELIEKKAKSNVFLTVLGFGMGNYKDGMLEQVANHGNGHYAYIDTLNEAKKVLVHDLDATLVTIAKDVKIQIEMNPKEVSEYRLIGYENRVMAHHEFNDDTVDAGEIGAGHRVTALYEIVPAGRATPSSSSTDPLKYQAPKTRLTRAAGSGELMSLKLRFKQPTEDQSTLREYAVLDTGKTLAETSADFRFAAAVAAFGMILRDSEHRGSADYPMVRSLAAPGARKDPFGYRREFLQLVKVASTLSR